MSQTLKIEVECESCDGTGLYRGMAEPPGVAVVCLNCDGTGCVKLTFKSFHGLKKRRDVKTVQRSRGSFIGTGVGPAGRSITYGQFLEGRRP
ncbi:MAG TPA: hypothetical protein VKG38_15785 [Solirubrobacteraceae bacterium]|nr:hypothetical protein [Solirubrobacteraceae bacterium]